MLSSPAGSIKVGVERLEPFELLEPLELLRSTQRLEQLESNVFKTWMRKNQRRQYSFSLHRTSDFIGREASLIKESRNH
jgi:hypothetical protein